jgi:hypothetical protein
MFFECTQSFIVWWIVVIPDAICSQDITHAWWTKSSPSADFMTSTKRTTIM